MLTQLTVQIAVIAFHAGAILALTLAVKNAPVIEFTDEDPARRLLGRRE